MIFSNRWFALFLVACSIWLLPLATNKLTILFALACSALLVASIADVFLLPSRRHIEVNRTVEEPITLHMPTHAQIECVNRSDRSVTLVLHEEPPIDFETEWVDTVITISPHSTHRLTYRMTAENRGDHLFGNIAVRVFGPLKLIVRQHVFTMEQQVAVYPEVVEGARQALSARRNRLQNLGVRTLLRRGVGKEFDSLREFTQDDEIKRIDWSATARRRKLIARTYQVERSQTVVLAIDTGRTMMPQTNGRTKLDNAITTALQLALVCAEAEDRVGLITFSGSIDSQIPAERGRLQVTRLIRHLYNCRARPVEPDYRTAMTSLLTRYRSRSLVVVFSDLWDPDSSRILIEELVRLKKKHVVLCVTVSDPNTLKAAYASVTDIKSAVNRGVATHVLHERERAVAELRRRGIMVVDQPADRLTFGAVAAYLEVKEKGKI